MNFLTTGSGFQQTGREAGAGEDEEATGTHALRRPLSLRSHTRLLFFSGPGVQVGAPARALRAGAPLEKGLRPPGQLGAQGTVRTRGGSSPGRPDGRGGGGPGALGAPGGSASRPRACARPSPARRPSPRAARGRAGAERRCPWGSGCPPALRIRQLPRRGRRLPPAGRERRSGG